MKTADPKTRDCWALTFASIFPLVMTYTYFVVLNRPDAGANPLLITAFGIGKLVQFLFPVLYVWWFEREQIGLPRPTLRGMALGVGFALFVGVSMWLLYFLWIRHIPVVADKTPVMVNDRLKQFGRDSPMGFLIMAAYICGLHSFWEEYYWRWFVFGWMRRYVPMAAAIVLSGIGFMLHHVVILGVYFPDHFWTLAMPFSLCVAFGGGVWAWLYQHSGSLYAPWLSHALIDAAIMGLGYWMLRGYWT
jgi:membrane protease YdiL (CAAX protease family)